MASDAGVAGSEERHRKESMELRTELEWSRKLLQSVTNEKESLEDRVLTLENKSRAVSKQITAFWGEHFSSS